MTTQKPNVYHGDEIEKNSLDAISQLIPAGTRDPYIVGYARVSTDKQDWALQHDAIQPFTDWIVTETASGARGRLRPVRDALLEKLGQGDALVIWKLDRLGRSTIEILSIVEDLARRGVQLISVTDHIDPTTNEGRAMLGILAVMAEYEGGAHR